jgi:UDP-N-acetyl-D-mannosaminuronic acid dehydrogenase
MSPERLVSVVGLGVVGLPTAALLASAGHRVRGVDIDAALVADLCAGRCERPEPGLAAAVAAAIASGRLTVATDVAPANVHIVAVPTPVDAAHAPDLAMVEAAVLAIAPVLRAGDLVVIESTVPPGATARMAALLAAHAPVAAADILVAYSPERVLPGNALAEIVANARVVGGITPDASAAAAALYRTFCVGEVVETDAATAELVKLFENTWRDITIAAANSFARIAAALGVDGRAAISLANAHPRVAIPDPGPGVGGHCIPVDPWFLVAAAPDDAALLVAARAVNDGQPARIAAWFAAAHAPATGPVVVLGVAYKGGVDDVRESPALAVVADLRARGYDVRLHDPYVHRLPGGEAVAADLRDAADGAIAALVLTDHPAYRQLAPADLRAAGYRGALVHDARGVLDAAAWQPGGVAVVGLLQPAPEGAR